jgi:hypothetical protein
MRRHAAIFIASIGLMMLCAGSPALAFLFGPGPGITGNDTGGIIPYSPAIDATYKDMAADWCARWHRLSHVTSVHRVYGDYVSFVCIDKPWMIH